MDKVETHGRASLQLSANIKDNLGAMYNKHQMFEDALKMHREAVDDFKQIQDSVGMMTAWRNCGRAAKSLGWFAQTKQFYDNAFQIATLLSCSYSSFGSLGTMIFFRKQAAPLNR